MNSKLKIVLLVILSPIGLWIGLKMLFLFLSAGFAEAPISYVWREVGGVRGYFLGTADTKLAADEDLIVAQHAASRLHTGRQCSEEDSIIALATKEKRPQVQRWLLQALGACKTTKGIPVLRSALNSSDAMIAGVAAQELGVIRAQDAIPDLERLVSSGELHPAGVAAEALSRMGKRGVAYSWALKRLSEPWPQRDIQLRDRWSRYYAASVIVNVGDKGDIPLLEKNRDHIAAMNVDEAIIRMKKRTQ